MEKHLAIGADIGGSHITCAAVDLTTREIIKGSVTGREVDNQESAEVITGTWADALREVMSVTGVEKIKGIGFAMPGPFDYVKGISYIKGVTKYEKLYGLNIGKAISSRLGVSDDLLIRFMNDASSFAVGEAWAGSASSVVRSLDITLGTGFGSAFINGKIPVVDGPEVPRLGCVYHLPYREGIADDYFSTRWFTGEYKMITGKEIRGVRELAEIALSDRIARDLFTDFGERLGVFLAPWLKGFGAEMLVIGGNISHAFNLFGEALEKALKREECDCQPVLSALKEDAAILGSACLLDDDFWKSVQHALPLM
ncbi:MAG: ROK family protein [Bacteroidales bacterium]|nr:ROK family protein [Bacteroidales bacterium]MBN2632799.1 ROK family protein [Bacteroidales bacterium]